MLIVPGISKRKHNSCKTAYLVFLYDGWASRYNQALMRLHEAGLG
jgi:hypothetical protein